MCLVERENFPKSLVNLLMPGGNEHYTKKMKFFIKDFFIKCDQILRKLRIWSHLLQEILNGKTSFLCSEKVIRFVSEGTIQ